MTKRIFLAVYAVALSVLILTLTVITGLMYNYFGNLQEDALRDELYLASHATEQLGQEYLKHFDSGRYRLTWISSSGDVLYDTHADTTSMDNHADREEISEAFSTGSGSSSRFSSTLTEKTLYEAIKLSDGSVLRISVSQVTAWRLMIGMLYPVLIIAIAATILSAVLAKHMAKRVVAPLNSLNLEEPLENNTYEELSPLLSRIHHQHEQINAQLSLLKQKTDEFNYITENMKEGLVLLDSRGYILSMNSAACSLFNVRETPNETAFWEIDHNQDMMCAIDEAQKNGHSSVRRECSERSYQFDISRIDNEDETAGLVIIAFDVSEREFAERSRREFTANVSHELKTPLTSIIGSAELIENNLVKQEDLPRFVGHIRSEASRLLVLIEDIIRLSQLDEGRLMPSESVDLKTIAAETIYQLHEVAEKHNIHIELAAEECVIIGVSRLLHEIVYNLIDNAIKYNVDGGRVDVCVSKTDCAGIIRVKDTGIGIPPEHQARVFERFYRVDKSHSKQSGGTGLGLSIVKHAAAYLGAEISLQSEPGSGTEIAVTFRNQ